LEVRDTRLFALGGNVEGSKLIFYYNPGSTYWEILHPAYTTNRMISSSVVIGEASCMLVIAGRDNVNSGGVTSSEKFVVAGEPCAPNEYCGDGVVQSGEECDDGGCLAQFM
jgi:hypothetical protein